jgi:hypothetical protein
MEDEQKPDVQAIPLSSPPVQEPELERWQYAGLGDFRGGFRSGGAAFSIRPSALRPKSALQFAKRMRWLAETTLRSFDETVLRSVVHIGEYQKVWGPCGL